MGVPGRWAPLQRPPLSLRAARAGVNTTTPHPCVACDIKLRVWLVAGAPRLPAPWLRGRDREARSPARVTHRGRTAPSRRYPSEHRPAQTREG